jgi:two-component system cell cycle sensor histidine kinase/response regulator CckA
VQQMPELGNGQKTILVVDDDTMVLRTVSDFLTGTQYNIITATSGAEALQRSRDYNGKIHVLLSDLQMPEMSGVALATELSAERPQLKVLLMSGFLEGVLKLNEGWRFMAKPFIPSQLRELVAGLSSADSELPSKSEKKQLN